MQKIKLVILIVILSVLFGFFYCCEIRWDGVGYYSWLRSLFFDHDLKFGNEYRIMDPPLYTRLALSNGYWGNHFTIGTAILWFLFFILGHFAAKILNAPLTGFSLPYLISITLGSIFYALVGLFVLSKFLRSFLGGTQNTVFWLIIIIILGTNFPWYVFVDPSYSHAISFFAVSLFLLLWWQTLIKQTTFLYVLTGITAGMMVLVRLPDLLFLLLMFLCILKSPNLKKILGFLLPLSFLLFFQFLAWKIVYGKWFLIPQGSSFINLRNLHLTYILLSPWNGLFLYQPVFILSCIGLIIGAVKDKNRRSIWIYFILIVFLLLILNSATADWWGGGSFGYRRVFELLPIFSLGLYQWLILFKPIYFSFFVGVFTLWSFSLFLEQSAGVLPGDKAVPNFPYKPIQTVKFIRESPQRWKALVEKIKINKFKTFKTYDVFLERALNFPIK